MKAQYLLTAMALVVPVLVISGCTATSGETGSQVNPGSPGEVPDAGPGPEHTVSYSLDELALHSEQNDCWMAINGKVYDVTGFVSSHPGGKAILEGCGTDATELFETRPMGSGTPHSQRARDFLPNFYIGELA